ncbi:hypothetical protein [Marinobacterium sp. LSUCC0821]|jgi:hypothetical protein|uniref:hypothetical protein n=1 Tax=Marinobacterium sp. LSUCC0821 TaxID=2668067 RepID=UPI00145237B9|nr:hypothetical protein [Marinobacterium sp. LSUCC0821]QJD71803.1 hypothetical protein HH196_08920 [Marinobacterium sp. LSUCC0821]
MNQLLATIEPFLFWVGLAVFATSLVMYGKRTGEWSAIVRFWEPLINYSATEFKINRSGLSLMILAVVIRVYLNFFA